MYNTYVYYILAVKSQKSFADLYIYIYIYGPAQQLDAYQLQSLSLLAASKVFIAARMTNVLYAASRVLTWILDLLFTTREYRIEKYRRKIWSNRGVVNLLHAAFLDRCFTE